MAKEKHHLKPYAEAGVYSVGNGRIAAAICLFLRWPVSEDEHADEADYRVAVCLIVPAA